MLGECALEVVLRRLEGLWRVETPLPRDLWAVLGAGTILYLS